MPAASRKFLPRLLPRLRERMDGLPWLMRVPLKLLSQGLLLSLASLFFLSVFYSWMAGKYDPAEAGKMPERTIVYDRQGREMGRLHGENRIMVKLKDVAPVFIEALLAREDNDFREHGGIAWRGVARAIFRRVTDGAQQGASTITMQLARNSYDLTREKSLHRKLLEIAITRKLESHYNKDQILELYINRIFYGTNIYGLQRACQCYFGKPARDLSLDEAAMLAAIIRGPNVFSPFRHYEKALSGRDMVLDRMVATGRLSQEAADMVKQVKTRVLPPPARTPDSWAMDAVRRDLGRVLSQEAVDQGGLKVYTTLDPSLQAAAQRALGTRLPGSVEGAAIAIDNATGATLAIVGGADAQISEENHALSPLPPGPMQALNALGGRIPGFPLLPAWLPGMDPGPTLENLANALSVTASAGKRARPWLIDRVEDSTGLLVFRSGIMHAETMSPKQARALRSQMENGLLTAAAVPAGLLPPVAGIVSPADDPGAWAIGITPAVTCGVWAGDTGNMARDSGLGLAVPIWLDIMRNAQRVGYHHASWEKP